MANADDAVDLPGAEAAHDGRLGSGSGTERVAISRPVVATAARWAAGSVTFALVLAAGAEAILLFTHSSRPLTTFGAPLAVGAVVGSFVLLFALRAEESQLARELRIARTGTPLLRAWVVQRRVAVPLVARFVSTRLGAAAVSLADGDRESARDALANSPALMRGGRIEALRAAVEADLDRSSATSEALDRCVGALRGLKPSGNREVDLYVIHVLVKAVLARGDDDAGLAVARQLSSPDDDETRIYATWLRVWFGLDVDGRGDGDAPWPDLSEGDLRLACLVARSQGADALVAKLTVRLSGIAPSEPRG